MGDCIKNRHTHFEVCPNCHKKSLKVREWEEHLDGWGIPGFRVEYFRVAQCINCLWEQM